MNNQIRIAALSDSPKIHSGFGTVVKELYQGFHDEGYLVHALGFMDSEYDYEHVLPYYFDPVNHFDELAHSTYPMFLRKVKPDIILIMTDPGNLVHYMDGIVHQQAATYQRNGREFIPPVVAYTPIEGTPMIKNFKLGFESVLQTGGRLIFYNETARKNVAKQWPEIAEQAAIVEHGLDHANFRRYSSEERRVLKQITGLDKYFVIGAIGANKRTKGLVELIYTAVELRKMGMDENIKFYCHTNPKIPTMFGYLLEELAEIYGVADMFLWKRIQKGSYWSGIVREKKDFLEGIMSLDGKVPATSEERGLLFYSLDYVSMMNCLDMYVDLSRNEGWGLPVGEAMASGVPTLMLDDGDVRSEIYANGYFPIKPLDRECWTTLHTGARLPLVDPREVAAAIAHVKSNAGLMEDLSHRGRVVTKYYKWANSIEKMNKIVKEVADFVIEEDRAYA